MASKYKKIKRVKTSSLKINPLLLLIFFLLVAILIILASSLKSGQKDKQTKLPEQMAAQNVVIYEEDWVKNPNKLDSWRIESRCLKTIKPGTNGKYVLCWPYEGYLFKNINFDVQAGTTVAIKFKCNGSYEPTYPPNPNDPNHKYYLKYEVGLKLISDHGVLFSWTKTGEFDQRLCGNNWSPPAQPAWNLAIIIEPDSSAVVSVEDIKVLSSQTAFTLVGISAFRIEYTPSSIPTPKPIGAACSTDIECQTAKCGLDNDKDGYLKEKVHQGTCQPRDRLFTDCYDNNPSVFPGQSRYFSVHRGDGLFDYNCDGAQTREYPATCTASVTRPICQASKPNIGRTGFLNRVPNCGQTGTIQRCYGYLTTLCRPGASAQPKQLCAADRSLCEPESSQYRSFMIKQEQLTMKCR